MGDEQARRGPRPKNAEYQISYKAPILISGGCGHTWRVWPDGSGAAATWARR